MVWVEVDTLRVDALGCYGNQDVGEGGARTSPHADALAAEGVLFERAYATAPWTIPSLVSQFTGLYPHEHGALRILEPVDPDLVTVPERFRAAGWRTAGVVTNLVTRGAYGFDQGFERWDDRLARGHEGSTAHEAVDVLLGFADELADGPDAQLFLFLLLFEPHYRYEEHPGGRFGPGWGGGPAYAGPLTGEEELPELRTRLAALDGADAAFLRGRYLGEVARADDALGRLLDGLRQRGWYDDALILFTADHGEELLERGWLGHTTTLHDELVRVPLILRPPGLAEELRGTRAPHAVSQVDLAATLTTLAGIGDGGARGFADLIVGGRPPRRHLLLHSDFEPPLASDEARRKRTHLWGVVDGESGRKWIVDHLPGGEPGAPVASLYDLESDPGEERDLAGLDPAAWAAARDLWIVRGLLPEPLGSRGGGEPIPAGAAESDP